MPNHVHGIIFLDEGTTSLSVVVAALKSASTHRSRAAGLIGREPLWQRGFHDHVIRDETALSRIREYVQNNPAKWHLDGENPDRIAGRRRGPGMPGPYN